MSRARQPHRFPLYAPAPLESRLNPSGILPVAAPAIPAEVGDPPVGPVAVDVTFEVGDPPVIPVTVPIGPAVPA